jgi:hypothetical protein
MIMLTTPPPKRPNSHGQARISAADAAAAEPDLPQGVLFIAAFAKTRASKWRVTADTGPGPVPVQQTNLCDPINRGMKKAASPLT